MNLKHQHNTFYMVTNANSMVRNVIQIKSGIMKNLDVRAMFNKKSQMLKRLCLEHWQVCLGNQS